MTDGHSLCFLHLLQPAFLSRWWGGGSKQNRNYAPIFSLISCEWKVCMFHMREIRKLSFCSTVACYCSAWQMMMGIGEARSDCFPISPSSALHSPFFTLLHFLLIELSSKRRLLVLDLTGSRSDSSSKWAGNQTSSGCVSGSPSLYLFSYIWFDKSGTILTRAGLSMRMCERITVSRLWHLSLASRWGNYQSGHRLYLPWWNYTFFICPWWPNIPWSWLNNQGFKMMYQKMCLGIRY